MLSSIHDYTNGLDINFNNSFLNSDNDLSIAEYVIMTMKEFECISNIEILSYKIVEDQDEIDYNYHRININFKRKDLENINIPKYKYLTNSRYSEIIFRIRVHTNLHEKIIEKKILIPEEENGRYLIADKQWKATWQLCDASTYSQRGKITLKSRMPTIIYNNKKRKIFDINGEEYVYQTFSYALNSKPKRTNSKTKTKFINPLMLFASKMGLIKTIDFFGMHDIIYIVDKVDDDEEMYLYFHLDGIFIKVDKYLVDKYKQVQAVVSMLYNLANRDFPVNMNVLNDKYYWTCRVGYVGSVKNKNIATFEEKGKTTILMVERLLNNITINNLRLPKGYKSNIYFVLRWLIQNYDSLKIRTNMDLNFKRLRKNEYIVESSLGKKVSANIIKLIEKKSKSRLNDMENLLELFNFNSDIILAGMKNINDLVKSDDLVNDLTFLQDIAFSAKGPNSLGETSSKSISSKYRDIHISYMGRIDVNCSSNSDPGLSGSLTPFVQLYDGFYFSPEREPCRAHYDFIKEKEKYFLGKGNVEALSLDYERNFDTFEEFEKYMSDNYDPIYNDELNYENIVIFEKEEVNTQPSLTQTITSMGEKLKEEMEANKHG